MTEALASKWVGRPSEGETGYTLPARSSWLHCRLEAPYAVKCKCSWFHAIAVMQALHADIRLYDA